MISLLGLFNFINNIFQFIKQTIIDNIAFIFTNNVKHNKQSFELKSDAGPYLNKNIKIINRNEKMIKLWDIEDLEYMENDLDFGEKISLLFLLHGGTDPKYALQKYNICIKTPSRELHFLAEWARNEPNWKDILLEALCIIQDFFVIDKLGLDLNDLKIRYLPQNPEVNLSIHPVLKALYIMCEQLSINKRNDLISAIHKKIPKPQILDAYSKYLECYLLQMIDYSIIEIGNRDSNTPTNKRNCEIDFITQFLKENELDLIKEMLDNVTKRYNFTCNNVILKDNISLGYQNRTDILENQFPVKSVNSSHLDDINKRYKISNRTAGFILIINQQDFYLDTNKAYKNILPAKPFEKREGTNLDKNILIHTFELFGYQPVIYENQTHDEIINRIDSIIDETAKYNYDSLIVAILSHGFEGYVLGSNCVPVEVKTIRKRLASVKILGKPKFLIIQSCQGKSIQEAPYQPTLQTDGDPGMSPYANELVAWSTIPGFASIRDTEEGTWFIQELCASIRNLYQEAHLLDIVTLVIKKVSSKQDNRLERGAIVLPKQESTLLYKFYLPNDS